MSDTEDFSYVKWDRPILWAPADGKYKWRIYSCDIFQLTRHTFHPKGRSGGPHRCDVLIRSDDHAHKFMLPPCIERVRVGSTQLI